jgi:hypothetical protein
VNLLVLAPEPVDAAAVRSALPGEDLEGAQVMVVSPALQESGLKFWMSDADDAIVKAEETRDQTVDALQGEGATVRGTTGEADRLMALQDALVTFPADRILIFTAGDDESDIAQQARDQFGVQVDQRVIGAP